MNLNFSITNVFILSLEKKISNNKYICIVYHDYLCFVYLSIIVKNVHE